MSPDHRQTESKTPPDPPKETPDDKLAELKKHLANSQTQLDDITKTRDSLTAEIGTLSQVVDDTKKILAAYTAVYPGLDNDLKTIAIYDQTKMEFVACKISKSRQSDIDKTVSDHDKDTEDAKEYAAKLANETEGAKVDADEASAKYNAARDVVNNLKGMPKGLTDKDSAAKKLMNDIDAYERNKNYDAMYLQLKDALEPLVNDLEDSLLSVEIFKNQLYAAVLDLDATWDTARQKKQNLDAVTKLASSAQKASEDLVANRTTTLLKLVAALPPAPAPAQKPLGTSA